MNYYCIIKFEIILWIYIVLLLLCFRIFLVRFCFMFGVDRECGIIFYILGGFLFEINIVMIFFLLNRY